MSGSPGPSTWDLYQGRGRLGFLPHGYVEPIRHLAGPGRSALLSAGMAHPHLGRFMGRLDAGIRHLAFGPERALAAITTSNTVVLWLNDQRYLLWSRSSDESQAAYTRSAFSPDGKWLALAAEDGRISLWDLQARDPRRSIEITNQEIDQLTFSPDSQQLAAASASKVWLAAVDDGRVLWDRTLDEGSRMVGLLFRDTRLVAMMSPDGGRTRVWDVEQQRELPGIRFNEPIWNDGRTVFAPGGRGVIRSRGANVSVIRDFDEANPIDVQLSVGQVRVAALALSEDLHRVATGGDDGSVVVWRVTERNPFGELLPRDGTRLRKPAFSQNGRQLAVIDGDDTVRLWEVTSRGKPRALSLPLDDGHVIHALAFATDGTLLALVQRSDDVQMVEVETGKPRGVPSPQGDLESAATSADGVRLAIGDRYGPISLWDVTLGKPIGMPFEGRETEPQREDAFDPATEQRMVTTLAFSPDGSRLLSVAGTEAEGDKRIEVTVWQLGAPEPKRTLVIDVDDGVTGGSLHPNDDLFALALSSGLIRLWETSTGRVVADLMTSDALITSIAFSPNGRHLAVVAGPQLFLVDIDARALVRRACEVAGRSLSEDEWSDVAGTRPFIDVCH